MKNRANSDSFRFGKPSATHANLVELTEENIRLSQTITEIQNSLSWKVTTPLRKLLPRTISLARLPRSIHRVAVGLGGYRRSVILAAQQVQRSGFRSAALELKLLLSKKAHDLDLNHRYHNSFTRYLRPVAVSTCERNSISKDPLFSVIMPTYKPNLEWLKIAIESLQSQSYQNFELIIVDDGNNSQDLRELLAEQERLDPRIRALPLDNNLGISGATNAGISTAKGDLVAFMDHDDILEAHALTMMALAFEENPKCNFGYSDEDKLTEDGRYFSPHFKTSYDPVLLLQINYISHFTVFRSEFLKSLGPLRTEFDGLQDHELLLRAAAKSAIDQVFHVPHVLYHWRAHSGSTASVGDAKGSLGFGREIAAKEFFNNVGLEAVVTQNLEIPLQVAATSVSLRCDESALVSVVIPTRNQFELLRKTIESMRLHTSYRNYEIVIVDNGSEETDAIEYLSHLEKSKTATIIRSPGAFNFSKLVNLGDS